MAGLRILLGVGFKDRSNSAFVKVKNLNGATGVRRDSLLRDS
jgi:hypothetical protein